MANFDVSDVLPGWAGGACKKHSNVVEMGCKRNDRGNMLCYNQL
jgi:hypothetical protein